MSKHQGPYDTQPDFPVPLVENYAWPKAYPRLAAQYARWGQVRNGKWYAFYCNAGPPMIRGGPTGWGREDDTDPNWWWCTSGSNNPGPLVCRHGAVPGKCPDGSCGEAPGAPMYTPTEEEVLAAALGTIRLIQQMEAAHE